MKIEVRDANAYCGKSADRNFDEWMKKKDALHAANRLPRVREGEIWWAAVGENVGVEINGKSKKFSRPILVYRMLGRRGFLAIPLTSQPHDGDWYVGFRMRGKMEYAALAQIRVLSVARLYDGSIGRVPAGALKEIRKGLRKLYF